MPRADYKTCRGCGKHTSEVGPLSHTRLCGPCSRDLAAQAYDQLTARSGPVFRRWRERIVASAGGVLLDDTRAKP